MPYLIINNRWYRKAREPNKKEHWKKWSWLDKIHADLVLLRLKAEVNIGCIFSKFPVQKGERHFNSNRQIIHADKPFTDIIKT